MHGPVIVSTVQIKPVKELAFAFKYGFQRGDGQAFAEAARAGEKELATGGLQHFVDVFGFVYVKTIVLS